MTKMRRAACAAFALGLAVGGGLSAVLIMWLNGPSAAPEKAYIVHCASGPARSTPLRVAVAPKPHVSRDPVCGKVAERVDLAPAPPASGVAPWQEILPEQHGPSGLADRVDQHTRGIARRTTQPGRSADRHRICRL